MEITVFMRAEVIQTLQLKQAKNIILKRQNTSDFFSRQEMNHFHTLQDTLY